MAKVTLEIPLVTAEIKKVAQLALIEVAENILEQSMYQVPVDSGDLRDSGFYRWLDDKTIEISYSCMSGDYDYAIRQHEDIDLHHPNGGKPFYLSDPGFEEGQLLPEIFVERWLKHHG